MYKYRIILGVSMKGYLTTSIVLMVACSGDKSLTVQNPAPTADIISHDDGSEILEGFTITLEGVVSDSNHTPDRRPLVGLSTERWFVKISFLMRTEVLSVKRVLDTDETEISLEVRDAEQKFGSDTINVVIVETEAPIAEIITPIADGVYYSDQLITLKDWCLMQRMILNSLLRIGNLMSMVCCPT